MARKRRKITCEDCRETPPLPNCRKCWECRDAALERCVYRADFQRAYTARPDPSRDNPRGRLDPKGAGRTYNVQWNELTDYLIGHE